ncbi:glutamyl-tRNA ligase [Halogeometricum borinquense DSM 11551]|uniref:Glutamate--tRNA ligase n=2 Tax=Halogeometricum borinquense TaxID=60847 RepID=E4NR47_HALBP|nr:glutamate--tRNA ligase [Halogeometricum borinquense]ADQ66783.1 glutamyl-tRNA synthetase [Halogeometricum borinquense DSM 11551]ELY30291.1 glutamyl-tRNA ligase [Halogeometricum borinquense DSM 11551]RYJ14245.1 glutamate--tRNA ligase [Halogeometricum borinquense]
MDDDLRERVEREAEKHALLNAVKYESDADVGAVMGPLMGENPDFRPHGDEIPGVVGGVVARVNDLPTEKKRDRLEELAPEELAEMEAEAEADDQILPDLPNVEEYDEVRMRAAPNPNGPWHIGHARMPAVIGTYKDLYDGSFIVRFDDTDPETKRPDLDAYDAILEDVEYLGFEPDEVLRASDRVETYYDHAREIIEMGKAYTCSCSGEDFSELKNAGEPCPHRDKDPETTREEFEAMIDGEYSSGEMVLRIKTDIEHKNPALRDWVAFRMVDTPHPREEAADYRCWPMLDFQSGVDDHLTGVTHIIRGIDLQDSAKRQGFLYDYFGWEYPEVVHWGHVQVDAYDVKMSTSTLKEKIEAGELDGWDDPRAPTLKSLRRRGIRGSAIVDAMLELGTSTSDVDLSMSAIYSNNRDIVDDEADRYFLVRDGERFAVEGGPDAGHPALHPDHEDRGDRTVPATDGVRIESADVPASGERVWLKGYGCVRREDDALVHTDDTIEAVRSGDVDVIHWAPAEDNVAVRMRTMEGDVTGVAEPDFADTETDDVVQFERIGFVRVDSHDSDARDADDESVVYWSHK